jgi:hypothetical protein
MPGFPGNAHRMDYIRKILEQCTIARVPGEDFNMAAVRPHQGTICLKDSNVVDEVSVLYIDELSCGRRESPSR